MINNDIEQLTPREHLLKRPSMYIGSIDESEFEDYFISENQIQKCKARYIQGLVKICNEIIDNAVDIAIKTDFKLCNKISVKMTDEYMEVQDNGPGIPVKKGKNDHWMPELAWGNSNSGSNFNDDANRTQIGMNGVGSFATNVYSKKFYGVSDDGNKRYTITFKNNAETYTDKIEPSKEKGVTVKFWPDFARFKTDKFDEVTQNIIKQRLINLNLCFPEIQFKFNSKIININSFKKYISMFNKPYEMYETDNYSFAIMSSPSDTFEQFSYVNGLKLSDGGTHIDIISSNIVIGLREKLEKKFKNIKPADIKNKLFVVAFLKNFKNCKFNSQTKEKLTNSTAEVNLYLGDVPYDKIVQKLFKNSDIMDPITEVYRIKEEFKKRQELKSLNKAPKKIRNDKYYPSTGENKYLMICEGFSAASGLMSILGRKGNGFYALRGKPLNAYSSTQSKFTANEELSVLYQIIKNENYEYIVYATDADLDGFHIRALLSGFFLKYMPEYLNKVGMLQTPVVAITKNGVVQRWTYDLNEKIQLKAGEKANYKKGLGSWTEKDLKVVLDKDGLGKMIEQIDFETGKKSIDDWLGLNPESRKEFILQNDFDIASA